MTKSLWVDEKTRALSESMNPLSRLGEPQEVASAIQWLLDSENSWVTGQTIGVDGGLANVMLRPRAKL